MLCTGSAEGGTAGSAAEVAQRWVKSFGRKSGFSDAAGSNDTGSSASSGGDGPAGGPAQAQTDFVRHLRSEVARAVLPDWNMQSVMKQRTDINAREIHVGEGPTDLVIQVSNYMRGFAC